ncbi:MAG: thiamine pyrophosphate-binding protein [Gemmatimonadota bacterium]|nr:thiamine pyrophosphate-binding protein [Gemmatimonadota bacterium]MDE3006045.1 thiamine pyrophosphate-binding protein [Gemmatimonadota bacterium]MDE3015056.1 thiamine pyrophosphate-binding protein [Gemmatimonadota bacterium]
MSRRTVDGLMRAGITHVVGIPDNTSGPLFDEVVRHPKIRLVPVTREGEAFALASGLWLGGASPLVVIQNTGLLEAGDGLRGTAQRMGAPIPFVVTGRGYAKMERAGVRRDDPRTRELLIRADVDSTALLTEPTLDAWGIPYERCDADRDPVEAMAALIVAAGVARLPSALVLTRALD